MAKRKDLTVLGTGPKDHVVVFYRSQEELADRVAEYLLGAIGYDGVAIVLATPAHRQAIGERLARAGADLDQAREDGSYRELDAAEVIGRFMISGSPDPAGFWRAVSPVLRKASRQRRPIRVFGEMVALMWEPGLVGAAIEVEALWNELGAQFRFALLCAYPDTVLRDREHADELVQVCGAHSLNGGRLGPGRISIAEEPEV